MSEEVSIYGDEPTYIVEAPKSTPKVKIKKLHPDAVIPTKATLGSACYDVYAPCNFEVRPGRSVMPLGLAIELPAGYAAEIRSRSGYSSKGFAGNEVARKPRLYHTALRRISRNENKKTKI